MQKTILGGALAAILTLGAFGALAEPRQFQTPEEAVGEVITTLQASDRDGLIAIFGPESEDVILSGDDDQDREDWKRFFVAYGNMHRIVTEGDSATLYVGTDQWPFPVPLTKGGDGKWSFDAEAAREEILDRRIGRNELDVIELMQRYVRVQANYRQHDYDGDGVMEFASGILSTEGKRDGLYWPPAEGAPESPVGNFIAQAAADGYSVGGTDSGPDPYLGYYYRILTKQGAGAPGGAMDYMVNGHMVASHAMIAFPANYGDTGVMSFLVGENGIVYEADLGDDTIDAASAIESFDPGDDWKPVE